MECMMDIEKFMDNLADEMEKLEMEMRSEAFYRDVISRSDDVCMSNLACGARVLTAPVREGL
jgi:hypothetical protein